MTKSRNILPKRRFWTDIELQMLRDHFADSHTADLARVLGREPSHILAKANAMGLHKSRGFIAEVARERSTRPDHGSQRTRFKPDHVPSNKGLRRPGWAPGDMAKTQFKKGVVPHTWKPVGSLRVNADGYLDRKVSDTGYPPRDWRPVHRLVWEAAHGEVPQGHVVVFKQGRRTTDPELITPDAVELITRRELMARNTVHNLPKSLVEIVQLRGVLNRQINKRAKETS